MIAVSFSGFKMSGNVDKISLSGSEDERRDEQELRVSSGDWTLMRDGDSAPIINSDSMIVDPCWAEDWAAVLITVLAARAAWW